MTVGMALPVTIKLLNKIPCPSAHVKPRSKDTTKFTNTLVITLKGQRKLASPLKAEQKEFLAALEVGHLYAPLT